MALFCRHNRFLSDCPICSKGTVLDRGGGATPRHRQSGPGAASRTSARDPARTPAYTGPYAAAGPYDDHDGRYEVRLERVPGGLRLAEWASAAIRRRAPVLDAADVRPLVSAAADNGVLAERDRAALAHALAEDPEGGEDRLGRSPGRSGELRDELRVQGLGDGRLRIARWVLRPNVGWELQETPVMLPAARYAEALATAKRGGALEPS